MMDAVFPSSSQLRVSDAEREAVADFLKRHYAAGRLTEHELSERVDAAYGARWESQLVALTDDLPGLDVPDPAPRRLLGLRRAATAVAALVAIIVLVGALPAQLSILFVAVTLPMLMMLAVMLVPLALAVLAVVWLTRLLGGRRRPHPALFPRRQRGWVGVRNLGRSAARRRQVRL